MSATRCLHTVAGKRGLDAWLTKTGRFGIRHGVWAGLLGEHQNAAPCVRAEEERKRSEASTRCGKLVWLKLWVPGSLEDSDRMMRMVASADGMNGRGVDGRADGRPPSTSVLPCTVVCPCDSVRVRRKALASSVGGPS